MQGSHITTLSARLSNESVWFNAKLISQFLTLSFLLTNPFYLSYLHAAPVGGEVVGGSGSISQSNLTTTINQNSQSLAIDWQSFDVNTNERVQFIQPNSSSLALNRIIGNNGTTIQGQIDSNGQVLLVNPNGIYFTSTASINVGGLVASSLDITTSDFMNGNYIFNEVLGVNGTVINSGIINASVGGNVALIGKQIKNDGLISANLGSVVLATGKQSILTFDNQGLIGVTVTKEVLQKELGLEEAIVNNGEIKAEGGRVLLTASVSQDVFSSVVNTNNIDQATSVVVNADGSFTLGGGSNVLNTGTIDVSSDKNLNNTARIILLGENVTSSGTIKADTKDGEAGEIEVHSKNKTLFIDGSVTYAQAHTTGRGGLIKVFGDKVGLFDTSEVNASGANGGGEVLIGGDRQGLNNSVRNAEFIYLGENTSVKADATDSGDGGKIIAFAKDTARIHGGLYARGGLFSGNGGFIETSGLIGLSLTNAPDVSSTNGIGGTWLIDPNDIRIVNDGVLASVNINTAGSPFETTGTSAVLEVGYIETALGGGDVTIETTSSSEDGDISFEANLDFNSAGNNDRKLTLKADNDIIFTSSSSITDSFRGPSSQKKLDLELQADNDNNGIGNVSINTDATGINLFDGDLIITRAASVTFNGGAINTGGGKLELENSSAVAFDGGAISTSGGDVIITSSGNVTSAVSTVNSISTANGDFIVNDANNFDSSNVDINVASGDIDLDGNNNGVVGTVTFGSLTANDSGNSDLIVTGANSISQSAGSTIIIARNTELDVTSGGASTIDFTNSSNNFGSVKLKGTTVKITDTDSIDIDDSTVTARLEVTAGAGGSGNITDSGIVTVSNGSTDAVTLFDAAGNITIDNADGNNNFNNVNIKNAVNVTLEDNSGGLAFAANDGDDTGGITGNLNLNVYGGDITSYGEVNAGTGLSVVNFRVNDNSSITLNNNKNTFDINDVNFLTTSGNINNLTFTDNTALDLKDITVKGNLIVSGDTLSFDHTHINTDLGGGIFSATTTNASGAGSITQDTSDITVFGAATTTLNATGNITLVDTDNSYNDVTISNGKVVSIRDTDEITIVSSNTSGNLTITANGYITLAGDISTNSLMNSNAGNVNFVDGGSDSNAGKVLLAADVVIDTQHQEDAFAIPPYTDGYVRFDRHVDNNTDTTRYNLGITSGDGNVTFDDNVGASRAISSLTINKNITSPLATINLRDVRTIETSTMNSNNSVDITAATINLNGDIDTNRGSAGHARSVLLTGNVVLTGNSSINTGAASTDGNVTVTGTINSDSTPRRLAIDSQTGAVDLQSTVGVTNALASLRINAGASQLGVVNLQEVRTNGGDNVIDVDGTTINLSGNLTSSQNGTRGTIRLDGDIVLQESIAIYSGGSSGGNGLIVINGDINSDNANPYRTLSIDSGNKTIAVNGSIGNIDALQKVDLITDGSTGTKIDVNAIRTTDADAVTNTPTVMNTGVKLTAASIDLGGNITSNTINGVGTQAGEVDVNGAVNLSGNVSINTNLAGSTTDDGNVDFSSTIQSATPRSLTIDAGNANVNVASDIGGGSNELSGFTVTNAGQTNVRNITTRQGGVDITSGTVNLYGGLNTTANSSQAGSIILDGSINLLAAGDVALITDVSGTDALININGAVNNTTSKNLTLNAGLADVSMTGTAGAGVALQSLTVTGDDVALGQVTTKDEINVTGNTSGGTSTIDLSGDLTTSTALGTVDLSGANVSLLSDVDITTTDQKVTITGDVDSDSTTQFRTLIVSVGNSDIEIGGNIGAGTNGALQKVDLITDESVGTNISVNAITTTDADAVTNTTILQNTGVKLTAETINLGGNITSNTINGTGTQAGEVDINGNIDLDSNVSINTNLAGSTTEDGNVDFSGTIDSTTPRSLTIDAGNANVNVASNIGSNDELTGFTVTNAGTTDVRDITTRSGGVDITSDTINLYGGLTTTANSLQAGSIQLDGIINLNAIGDIVLSTDVSGTDSLIDINGTVNNSSSKNLTLNAGLADVSMTGTAGAGVALQSLTVTGDDVALGQVTTKDEINVTGNTSGGTSTIDLSGDLITTATGATSSINLNQANVTLSNNVTLQVNNTSSNSIIVEGVINSDLNTNNRSLTINAGSGTVDLQGEIGTGANGAIQGISITSGTSSTTNLQRVVTRSGGAQVTASSLNLDGNIEATDDVNGGDISLTTEKIDLTSDVVLQSNSSASDGSVEILTSGTPLGVDGGTNALVVNAGDGDVTIDHNVTNVSSFDLQSSGTTILNGVASLGTIVANASNGLTLNNSYSAITLTSELMSFNADSDSNGVGSLILGTGASVINTSGPISFTGATFGTNNNFSIIAGTGGTESAQFSSTGHFSLGNNSVGFRLNSTQIGNIQASEINISAANDIYYSNVSQLTGPDFILVAGNDIRNSGTASTFSSLNATASNNIVVGANITSEGDMLLTASNISITGSRSLRSNNGNIILDGQITGASGSLSLYADNVANNGFVQFFGSTSVSNLNSLYISADDIDIGTSSLIVNNGIDLNVEAANSGYAINSNIESLFSSVRVNAGDNALIMDNGVSVKAATDVTLLNNIGDIGLSLVESTSGSINVISNSGAIYDNNGTSTNIISSGAVRLEARNGIGSGNELELNMNGPNAEFTAINSTSGSIEVSNSGDITLTEITNSASNSSFIFNSSGGDITIGLITLDNNIASINAEAAFNVLNGNVYGVNGNLLHVSANSATFNLNGGGEVGNEVSNVPLIVDIRYKLTDINTTNTYIEYYLNRKPQIYEGANQFKNKALQAIENISGQQLIEVEALGDVDEAIFSDVRNYSHSDIALMMPVDQRYTEDEEEDEEQKLKRQKLLNSSP